MRRVALIDANDPNAFALNRKQNAALDAIESAVENGTSVSITGSAGTGKSQMLREACNLFDEMGVKYKLTAMTHKACAVVTEKTGRPCRTTHSTLCLAPKLDYKTGKEILTRRKGDLPDFGTIIIVDEAYMASESMYKHISRFQHVCSGDPYQIPPVGEPFAPGLVDLKTARLTEVMRHDNAILDLATSLCKSVKTGAALPPMETNGEVKALRRSEFEEAFYCAVEEDVNSAVYATWTNRAALRMIGNVRSKVLKRDKNVPEVGEIMVANNALIDPDNDDTILGNNTEVLVEGVEEKVFEYAGYDIEGYTIRASSEQQCPEYIDVATDTSIYERMCNNFRNIAMRDKNRRSWKHYFLAKSRFADLRFTYASTTHKLQGSTIQKCFVDVPDIMQNQNPDELARLLYVACSRPSHELYLKL